MATEPFNPQRIILYIEDSEDDIFFFTRALQRTGAAAELRSVSDGFQAMDYLMGKGRWADRTQYPLPVLIFCDLKMPRVGGLEFLTWLRQQKELEDLPVYVLTSSQLEGDREMVLGAGATGYIVKPSATQELEPVLAKALQETGLLENGVGDAANAPAGPSEASSSSLD